MACSFTARENGTTRTGSTLACLDPELGQYGGRTVHAVAVDHLGNVYAGNDSGLLIYQQVSSPSELFIENGHAVDLFADQDVRAVQAQSEILLKHVKAGTPAGQLVAHIQTIDSEIDNLKQYPEPNVATSVEVPINGPSAAKGPVTAAQDANLTRTFVPHSERGSRTEPGCSRNLSARTMGSTACLSSTLRTWRRSTANFLRIKLCCSSFRIRTSSIFKL